MICLVLAFHRHGNSYVNSSEKNPLCAKFFVETVQYIPDTYLGIQQKNSKV